MDSESQLEQDLVTKNILKLRDIQSLSYHDESAAHIQADDVLCDILNQLGFEDVVEEYRKIPKWYS